MDLYPRVPVCIITVSVVVFAQQLRHFAHNQLGEWYTAVSKPKPDVEIAI